MLPFKCSVKPISVPLLRRHSFLFTNNILFLIHFYKSSAILYKNWTYLFSGDLVLSLPTIGGTWGSAATRGRTRNRQKGTYDEFIKKISMATIVIPNFLTSVSIARRNTSNTTFGLIFEIWPFTKIYLSSINTSFHTRSELGHFTCCWKIGAFFWNITKRFWPKQCCLTLNQSDAMKIWCMCTLARVVGGDKNSIQIPSDAIDTYLF